MFSLNKNKALGPDGFSAGFFQRAWPIVGEDVIEAILDFFSLMVSSLERLMPQLSLLFLRDQTPQSWGILGLYLVAI